MIEDEEDEDWSFVPKAILDHKKIVTQRYVLKMYQNSGETGLKLHRNSQLRVKVLWKDGTISWCAGDALQLQNPFLFIPYVIKKGLQNHIDFKWTKEYIKENSIYKNIFRAYKAKSQKMPTYKFGIQIPNNPQHAYKLDKINNDREWEGSMDKEIGSINNHQVFIILEDDEPLPEGYKLIPYHFVFDAKFDGRRKARLVAGGHRAPDVPENEIYSGVVSIETIRVAFVLAAMNNLDVCAADVSTAFLYGKTREKVYVIAGEEFGQHKGKRMLIDKGLYGLASSAARFHDKLSSTLRDMGFVPSKADYDLWMRKQDDHYEYIATWVDDLLVFSKKPMEIINTIKETYDLKGVAAMNNLDVCAADVSTAFLYGKTREKVYVIAGEEFGQHKGKRMLIDKGLYGLASSAARFHDKLSSTLRDMGFVPSKADYDLWMRKQDDHYEYIATWVDDLLVFSKKPMEIINTIKETYDLKGVGAPEYYLGSDYLQASNQVDNNPKGISTVGNEENDKTLSPLWLRQGIKTAFSARTYISNTIDRLETMIGKEFPQFDTPMSETLHPELDDSPLLDSTRHSQFRSLVGCANWLVILGRFDIAYATNTFSRFGNEPRMGHLKGMIRVFGYLKRYSKGKILIDPNYPNHENHITEQYDNWKEFYPEAEEDVPTGKDKPDYLGPPVRITAYKDSDHAHDLVTRRSVTGILLLVNNTPVKWISKRQKTIETSTYGAELVAAKLAVETILEYRTMLRLMGANVEKTSLLLGDNRSVVINTTIPSSVLKKKHCALSYHKVRETISCGILRFAHIESTQNYSDLLTKALPRIKFRSLVEPLLFRQLFHKNNIGK